MCYRPKNENNTNRFEEWQKVGSDFGYHYMGSAVWFTRMGKAFAALYGPSVPASAWGTKQPNGRFDVMKPDPRPDTKFCADWLAKAKEVIAGYQPDLHNGTATIDLERSRMPSSSR